MKLLADDVLLPTITVPDPPEGADVDEDLTHVPAALFEIGGLFLTADDWGNVMLWTPRYELGNPTKAQVMLASSLRKKAPQDVTDLDLFLVGGAEPTTIMRSANPTLN